MSAVLSGVQQSSSVKDLTCMLVMMDCLHPGVLAATTWGQLSVRLALGLFSDSTSSLESMGSIVDLPDSVSENEEPKWSGPSTTILIECYRCHKFTDDLMRHCRSRCREMHLVKENQYDKTAILREGERSVLVWRRPRIAPA